MLPVFFNLVITKTTTCSNSRHRGRDMNEHHSRGSSAQQSCRCEAAGKGGWLGVGGRSLLPVCHLHMTRSDSQRLESDEGSECLDALPANQSMSKPMHGRTASLQFPKPVRITLSLMLTEVSTKTADTRQEPSLRYGRQGTARNSNSSSNSSSNGSSSSSCRAPASVL